MTQYRVFVGDCSVCIWAECVPWHCWVECFVNVPQVKLVGSCSNLPPLCWFPVHLLHQLLRHTEMSSCNLGFVCFNGSYFECKYLLLFISLGILFCSPNAPPEWGAALQSTFDFSWRSVHCGLSTVFFSFLSVLSLGYYALDHSDWVLLHSRMNDLRSILWRKERYLRLSTCTCGIIRTRNKNSLDSGSCILEWQWEYKNLEN